MKATSRNLSTLLITTLIGCSVANASTESDVHDADPRNTAWRLGIGSSDSGEVKLVGGGGFDNLYGNSDDVNTQTIVIGEYFTQSEDFRLRLVNFDSRFGGLYFDASVQEAMDMYTGGYMLPLATENQSMFFFPSINYSYLDVDQDKIANAASKFFGTAISSDQVIAALGGSDAHIASFNIYGLKPWNETHYTVAQFFAGSSYGGIDDLSLMDLVLLQGLQTKLGNTDVNVFLEAKYSEITINNTKLDDTSFTVGIDIRL